jgi:Domain of unknown function (DUF4307)
VTDLDARYGRRPQRSARRRTALAWTGVSLAVVAVLGFAAWWWSAQDPYAARVRTYTVESDSLTRAVIEITNRGDQLVRCEIVAKDRYTQPVGVEVVETPAVSTVSVVEAALTTTGRAVTVVVRGCTGVGARVP